MTKLKEIQRFSSRKTKKIEILTRLGIIAIFLLGSNFIPILGQKSISANENQSETRTRNPESQEENKQTRRRINYTRSDRSIRENSTRIIKTRGSATRNGTIAEEYFEILAPTDSPSATISSHPSFTVYFDLPSNYTTIATLEENFGNTSKIFWEQEINVDSPGLKTITVPTEQKGLQPGKEYRFSVVMVVDRENRSHDIVAQVWLEQIELPPEVSRQIEESSEAIEVAAILAENGVWYDAMVLLLQEKDSYSSLTANLLSQVGLQEVAEKIN